MSLVPIGITGPNKVSTRKGPQQVTKTCINTHTHLHTNTCTHTWFCHIPFHNLWSGCGTLLWEASMINKNLSGYWSSKLCPLSGIIAFYLWGWHLTQRSSVSLDACFPIFKITGLSQICKLLIYFDLKFASQSYIPLGTNSRNQLLLIQDRLPSKIPACFVNIWLSC